MPILDLITLRYILAPILALQVVLSNASTFWLKLHCVQPSDSAEISSKDIDQLSKTSFPLCMRHMLEKVSILKAVYMYSPFDQLLSVCFSVVAERKPSSEEWG